jgi:ribose 5-phosphate isomerase A
MTQDELKKLAGEQAAEFVKDGMIVGLGHGSTAIHAIRRLAARIDAGELRDVLGVPCSVKVSADAEALGIPLTTLDQHPVIDVTIDGADEVDPGLNVIKGGGGALVREKIVAQASRREIIVVDDSKCSPRLGTHFAVPVEVIPFAYQPAKLALAELGAQPRQRTVAGNAPFISDQGNFIVDCDFGPIDDLAGLAAQLDALAGIVGHGLFLGLATDLIVAGANGITHQQRPARAHA